MPPTKDVDKKAIDHLVEKYIEENDVMIFSKSWCPYCTKVGLTFSYSNEIVLFLL